MYLRTAPATERCFSLQAPPSADRDLRGPRPRSARENKSMIEDQETGDRGSRDQGHLRGFAFSVAPMMDWTDFVVSPRPFDGARRLVALDVPPDLSSDAPCPLLASF